MNRHPTQRRRLRLVLDIDGMVAVHAVRALHTALSGIEGLSAAHVSMGKAELHYDGTADDASLEAALRSTLDVVGLTLRSLHIVRDRQLPLV